MHAESVSPRWSARLLPYAFVAAAGIYLLVLAGVPLIEGIWLGFTETNLLNPTGGSYVGLHNFHELLKSGSTGHSVVITCAYAVAVVVGSLVFGTFCALLINSPFRGRTIARVLLTLPWAMPTVAASLIFIWIYNQDSGVLNYAVGRVGVGAKGWLTDPSLGLLSVTVASIWMVFPFVMLVLLAALQSVPEEMYEAARVDGADALNTLKNVTLPLLYPTIRVVALLMTIWSLRRFEVIWLLTQGGPVGATNVLVVNLYREAFQFNELGMSAAIGVIGLCLSAIVTVVFFVLEQRAAGRETA
jgi:multiple sugar transport system permease protein